jgi:hypothetical protein
VVFAVLLLIILLSVVVVNWMGKYPPRRLTELQRWSLAGLSIAVGIACSVALVAVYA